MLHHGLWHHADFRKLWIGQTVSLFGSAVTSFALPLTAVLTLKAKPAQMGLLGAVEFAPFLLVGLFAGVWVDRLPRRPIMMAADFGRALLLGSIPVVAILGQLRMEYLYIVGFGVGILTVFFDVSDQSLLPSLVKREQLLEGNSKLRVSESGAQVIGPGLAGGLTQLVTAPMAIALDAVSFLLSALFLGLIRTPERVPVKSNPRQSIWSEIGEGLRVVLGNPLLRSIAGCTSTSNFFDQMMLSLYILYLTRHLGIKPSLIGVILAMGAIGAFVGALLARRVAHRFGLGPAIVGSRVIKGIGALLIPLANGPLVVTVPLLVAAGFLTGLTNMIYDVNQVSLRQTMVPERLQGRMNASMRFLVWGTIPLGSLLGGILGETISVRTTLFVGALGTLLAFLWVLFSPVWMLRDQPESD